MPNESREIRIDFEGESIPARDGEPIAASLLRAGVTVFSRSVKYHRPRGPSCLSGRCSHCLMQVDGEPNVATCMAPARDGTKVERQNAFPNARHDLFRAIDWMYPKGLDHHALFAGVPVVELAVSKVARHLAGLGVLPAAAHEPHASALLLDTDVLVVGAGPAGLAAAAEAAQAGARVTLLDEQAAPGGRLLAGLALPDAPAPAWVRARVEALERAGGRYLSRATTIGIFREGGARVAAARTAERRLLVVTHDRLIVATGAGEPLPAFAGNDLPGVFAGRALARLVTQTGVLPGERALIVGDGPEADAIAKLLNDEGASIVARIGLDTPQADGKLERLRGRRKLEGAVIAGPDGGRRKVRCELAAIVCAPAPLFDLARQAGAEVQAAAFGFRVIADETGRTRAPDVFACGEALGPSTIAEAIASGERAGVAAAKARP